MDTKLKKLEDLLALADRDTVTEDDFVQAFKEVMDYVKTSNAEVASILEEVFNRLDAFAGKLKEDNEQDRGMVKTAVGQAIAELRTELDARMMDVRSGKDGEDGLPGKDADEAAILARLAEQIPKAPEIVLETPDETLTKVNQSSLQIAKERVEGLVDLMSNFAATVTSAVGVTTTNFFKNGALVSRAKNINFMEGSNISLTMYQTGDQMNVQVTSTAAGSGTVVDAEVPTDSGDHTNFTIAHTPIAGSFKLYRGGSRQRTSTDYTLTGTALVLTVALDTADGEVLICDYNY